MASPPLNFVAVIFPGYQLLDVAGPLDVLNLLSTIPGSGLHSLKLTFLASTLDPVSNKAIPPKSAPWTFDTAVIGSSETQDGIQNRAFAQSFVPHDTFGSYLEKVEQKQIDPPDVVFIPGGVGVRLLRVYPSGDKVNNVADAIDFLVNIRHHVRHSFMSVCTGSWVLGKSGLLDGRRATTNVMRFDDVQGMCPRVRWLRKARWVKSTSDEAGEDGSYKGTIYTSAGVTAGIDMMLSLVAETTSVELARRAAKALEYGWSEIGEGQVDPLYDAPGWKEHLDNANKTLGNWHGKSGEQ